jgi:hypothetical protein
MLSVAKHLKQFDIHRRFLRQAQDARIFDGSLVMAVVNKGMEKHSAILFL